MTREKKNSAHRRVIVDLSWPHEASVNGGTPLDTYMSEPYKLQLPTAEDLAIVIAHYGPHCGLWARDLRRAYRQWRVDPLDWPLMGLMVENQYFVDTAVAFGLRHGASFAQRVSQAVCDILDTEGHTVIPYIDDFVGAAEDISTAQQGFDRSGALLQELGLEESVEKSTTPTTCLTWIGVEFNTDTMSMAIPPEVITDTTRLVESWEHKAQASRHELQVLLGKLFHSAKCSGAARLFVGRMLATLRAAPPQGFIKLTDEFRADLHWFREFLPDYNGVSLIHVSRPVVVVRIATTMGTLSAQYGTVLCSAPVPAQLTTTHHSPTHIDMFTLLVALLLWGDQWANMELTVLTDNPDRLEVLLKGRTRDPYVLHLARAIWLIIARRDIIIYPAMYAATDSMPHPTHFLALPKLPLPDFTGF
jgi:hypothetical protein